MGIHGLTKLLADNAPGCMKEQKFDNYFGRVIAVDASMHIYQFMVVVGRVGDQLLSDADGNVTSHLQGMFFRTVRMLEAGIKPVYVFDGKPPQLKLDLLDTRKERKGEAEEALKVAQEAGDQEAIERYSKRSVKVTKEHNEECKRLLKLLGVPTIDAPTEAEAQCAELCRGLPDKVYGVATEDMDALTFGAPVLIRHLMASSNSTQPITEFDRSKALAALGLTDEQFTDLCILCGCDYATNLKGIGPTTALKLINKHGSLEEVLENIDLARHPLPQPYPYKEAREFFLRPEVTPAKDLAAQLKWSGPDEEGLVQFLVTEKGFNEDRVRKAVARVAASKGKASQGRMESFFKPIAKPAGAAPAVAAPGKKAQPAAGDKRKPGAPAGASGAVKKGKMGVGGGSKKK